MTCAARPPATRRTRGWARTTDGGARRHLQRVSAAWATGRCTLAQICLFISTAHLRLISLICGPVAPRPLVSRLSSTGPIGISPPPDRAASSLLQRTVRQQPCGPTGSSACGCHTLAAPPGRSCRSLNRCRPERRTGKRLPGWRSTGAWRGPSERTNAEGRLAWRGVSALCLLGLHVSACFSSLCGFGMDSARWRARGVDAARLVGRGFV